ncbi:MAG: hypothetical protein OWQ54_01875 [Sulfolobaceae archaeon]|nr:hypothetical protein [Sulfolobaceae archaeon]
MKVDIKRIADKLEKPLSLLVTSNGVTIAKGSNVLDLCGTLYGREKRSVECFSM